MCLAKNIRYLRRKKEMSQDALADLIGYKSYTTVQKWEMGVSEPPIKQLRRMADLFGVDINDMATVDIEKKELEPEPPAYYLNPETAAIAQEVFENPHIRVLFDAAKDCRPEDIKMAADLLQRLKETNR